MTDLSCYWHFTHLFTAFQTAFGTSSKYRKSPLIAFKAYLSFSISALVLKPNLLKMVIGLFFPLAMFAKTKTEDASVKTSHFLFDVKLNITPAIDNAANSVCI